MCRYLAHVLCVSLAAALPSVAACSNGGSETSASRASPGGAPVVMEKILRVELALAGATLTISAKDGFTPVMTDAWLYTLTGGKLVPLTGFQDPDSRRKYRGFMMPCTLVGTPSGLTPCDRGAMNGVMTDAVRDTLVNGVKQSAIDGTVAVTLDAAPVDPIVVVAALEDQRYAGAAAIDPNGKPVPVPAGVGAPETHAAVSYQRDIKPMIDAKCVSCHAKGMIAGGYPLGNRDDLVGFDIAHADQVDKCQKATPGNQPAIDACIAIIQKTEYMVEPGNPALSNVMRRTRPDELESVSPIGLKWYGDGSGSRFDDTGDRRMPSSNTTATAADDVAGPTYYDHAPGAYQLLWDWVSQGAAP
jgi:hypothetical protein